MDVSSPAFRLNEQIKTEGTTLVLRKVSRPYGGPQPLANPPDVADLVVDGNASAGDTSLSLRGSAARGILMVDDRIFVPWGGTGVTGPSPSRSPSAPIAGFDDIPVLPLASDLADGTPVTMVFRADLTLPAMISSFPTNQVDGTRIQARDLAFLVSAYLLPTEPLPDWRVIYRGKQLTLVNAVPSYVKGDVVSWRLQAR